MDTVLQISPRITALPIIHGSGDFALEVRRAMLEESFDCLAVPLPPSFQPLVETAIEQLPVASVVLERESPRFQTEWSPAGDPASEEESEDEEMPSCSYVPIDPCQGVIMALRIALGEHLARHFIDLETTRFEPPSASLPDPYALKTVALERFSAAVLPQIQRPRAGQPEQRIAHMAWRLRALEQQYSSILLVCSLLEWPWIRAAYQDSAPPSTEDELVQDPEWYGLDPKTLHFFLGELPFITGLYERARSELEDDEHLSIDGVKELLLTGRKAYRADLKKRARKLPPSLLARCLKYIRNLSLLERRLTPDLYTIVVAAKQICGDQFALHVAETASLYAYAGQRSEGQLQMGIQRARLPDGEILRMINRLPGQPVVWRACDLRRRPDRLDQRRWQMRWNPFSQCSYPPEDTQIENFRTHVFERARAIIGADLIRTEKFTTSIRDGIDIRDTLRHWHDGDIYVKVLPAERGRLDCAVMLFDSPADPRDYPWRTTWFAEHDQESTLAFFATDYRREMVGPGIGLATYGGALFLFPPVTIPDIWTDRRLDFAETLEERLLAAACLHSQAPRIALLTSLPPGAGWRRLARRFKKTWVHVPLGQFGDSTVAQLRMVHVLNGRQVRSYAAHFIRRA